MRTLALALAVICIMLTACGQKGPLRIAEPAPVAEQADTDRDEETERRRDR